MILKDPRLLNNILKVLKFHMHKLGTDPRDRISYFECLMIMIDIKYMARPECIQYAIQNTDMLEEIIMSFEHIYLCESTERRTEMIEFESGPNEELINLELKLIKILNKYLREVKYNDLEKN
jgi:hypothetical protein